MSKAERLSHKTADITDENIEKIGALFPNCLTEAKDEQGWLRKAIDFDKLRQELSHEVVEGADERYRFDWPEKRKATLLANTPTKMTLRPCREESVNFDTTQNLYIEGDNLEVLKLLRENYYKQVKMIYIDPPYNTGKDSFVYDDDFRKSTEEFSDESDATDEDGNKIFDIRQNNESNGRFHTDWLNMMYPRLKVAKDLLRDDGVIFISIDDREITNLKRLCNEVFGECNFVANFLWKKKSTTSNVEGAEVSSLTDATLCYRRSKAARISPRIKSRETRSYPECDAEGKYRLTVIEKKDSGGYKRDSMKFPILGHLPREGKRWQIGIDKARELEIRNRFVFDGEKIQLKIYDFEDKDTTSAWPNLFDDCGSSDSASQMVNNEIFGVPELFDNPKPMELIERFSIISADSDSLILDFFSGSATTAHAVMKLNAEDGGKRKFIMVQLPEPCDEKSEAAKAGYKNICEIGKERIRRAGKKILEEVAAKNAEIAKKDEQGELELGNPVNPVNPVENKIPDVGFRVLKLDSSNMKDVYYNPKEFEEEFVLREGDASLAENIKPDRTGEDLLFDTMLRLGIPLSAKIAAEEIHGKKVFTVDDGLLMATFDKDLNEEAIAAIAKRKPIYFAMSDGGFATDNVADNFEQIWQEFSPDTKRKVI